MPNQTKRLLYIIISFIFLSAAYTNCSPSFESMSEVSLLDSEISGVDPDYQPVELPVGQTEPPIGQAKPPIGEEEPPLVIEAMENELEALAKSYNCSEVKSADKLKLLNRNVGPLTMEQYQNSVNEIFGLRIWDFPIPDLYGDKNYDTTVGLRNPGASLIEAYFTSAEKVIASLNSDVTLKNKFLVCSDEIDTCLTSLYNDTGKLLFKRALTATEKASLSAKAKSFSDNKIEQLEAAIYLLLISPQFNYHSYAVNQSINNSKMIELSELDLAQRLSFFIWGRVPDHKLLGLAEQNNLKSTLTQVISEMLADKRSVYLARSLAYNWFNMGNFRYNNLKSYDFSGLTQGQINWTLAEQTTAYFYDLIKNNSPVTDLFNSNFQYHNKNTAKIYKLSDSSYNQPFVKKTIDINHSKVGILTHIGVLAENSSNGEVQVHNRGSFIIDRALCAKPVGAPSGALFNLGNSSVSTIIAKVNHLSVQTGCDGCHTQMDPYGKALDNFNSLGLYRTTYSTGEEIKYSQELDGRTIASASDLSLFIKEEKSHQVNYCATKNILSLASGKPLFDDGSVSDDNKVGSCLTLDLYSKLNIGNEELKFQDLIVKIISNENSLFRQTSKLGQ